MWSLFQQFKCSSTHHHSTAKLLRNKFACQKCVRDFEVILLRPGPWSRSLQGPLQGPSRPRVTDLFLFGKKQGSIFGIIVLQPALAASKHLHAALEEWCVKTDEKQDIVFHNYFKRTFQTGFWAKNYFLNLCFRVVNSQRLFCNQKSVWNI